MGKRKKARAAKEPRENNHHHLHPHSRPSISTREHKRRHPARTTGSGLGSESDTSPPSTPDAVRPLVDPYSKPRLLAILAEAATANPALRARLGTAAAAASPSHRRLFVHGLPPPTDGAALAEAFSRFGPLADCHAVVDRHASGSGSGRCKGYGFVSFASRAAARRAHREAPRVTVAGLPVSVQFASAGPDPSCGGAGRRVYVTNVAPDASAERLRAFFARFGEERDKYGHLMEDPYGVRRDGRTDTANLSCAHAQETFRKYIDGFCFVTLRHGCKSSCVILHSMELCSTCLITV